MIADGDRRSDSTLVKSVARAARLLITLADAGREVSLTELSEVPDLLPAQYIDWLQP